jgi:pimeloyl-ACP methyl ester carboxylesterase
MPAPAAWAAGAPAVFKPLVFPGLSIELKTADGWPIKAKYSPARDERKTFVLLHGTGGRKEDWYYLAQALAKRGYGYFALDFRGHGESRTAPDGSPAVWRKFPRATKIYNEFDNMRQDVQAGVEYLLGQGLSEESLGVIGADVGSSLGLKHAAVHPKISMVVMLSPGLSYQEVTSVNAMRAYKDRPILMVYSEADKNSARSTPLLYEFAKKSAGERNATVITAAQERGTRMLRSAVIRQILGWIENPVKPESAPAESSATVVMPGAQPDPESSPQDPVEDPSAVPESGR